MEILDLYDKNGKLLNKTVERGSKNLADNEFIKVVTVWLECQGRYLIQKTAKKKAANMRLRVVMFSPVKAVWNKPVWS